MRRWNFYGREAVGWRRKVGRERGMQKWEEG
jgi:hypothetical protein